MGDLSFAAEIERIVDSPVPIEVQRVQLRELGVDDATLLDAIHLLMFIERRRARAAARSEVTR